MTSAKPRTIRALVGAAALIAATVLGSVVATDASAVTTTSISGTVRVFPFGGGLGGVTVMVLKPTASGSGPLVASATSDDSGRYAVTGLAPSGPAGYVVCFSLGIFGNGFISTCYANQGNFAPFPDGNGNYVYPSTSNHVVVTAAKPQTNIDETIYPSIQQFPVGTIKGKITDLVGASLGFVKIWAIDGNGNKVENTVSANDGTYTLTDLPIFPGRDSASFDVCVDGSAAHGGFTFGAFGKRCYKNVAWASVDSAPPATATAVSAPAGGTTSGINIKLPATL